MVQAHKKRNRKTASLGARHHGEQRKVGKRLWTPSKNLSKPKIERQYVSDDFTLTVPPGGYLIENPSSRNNYGEFSYLEYWQPGSAENAVI